MKAKLNFQEIENLDNVNFKYILINALQDSMNFSDLEITMSPHEISEKYKIGLDILRKFKIILDRRSAKEILMDSGIELEFSKLIRLTSESAYKNRFSRSITRRGTMNLYTLSEMQTLTRHIFNFEFLDNNENLDEEEFTTQVFDDLDITFDFGNANPEFIADLLSDISSIYRKMNGSGINFSFEEVKQYIGAYE